MLLSESCLRMRELGMLALTAIRKRVTQRSYGVSDNTATSPAHLRISEAFQRYYQLSPQVGNPDSLLLQVNNTGICSRQRRELPQEILFQHMPDRRDVYFTVFLKIKGTLPLCLFLPSFLSPGQWTIREESAKPHNICSNA